MFGNSITIPLGLAVFAVQVWACRAWLTHFQYGPLEWVWRSLTCFLFAVPRLAMRGRAVFGR